MKNRGKPFYIASLDVGTTTLRCVIFNEKTEIVGCSTKTIKLLYPNPGFVEINAEDLWNDSVDAIQSAIKDAKLEPKDITTLGISTQRASFVNWNRKTSRPLHNFITWKDTRAKDLCQTLNHSFFVTSFRYAAYSLYLMTRNERYLTGSRLKIAVNHVTGRLLWVISNLPQVKHALDQNEVMFGTVESWLLYKFSNHRLHVSDITNAAATGFYDPFVKEWGSWSKILGVPHAILPKVVPNDFDFGETHEKIFGHPIPIGCVMADQSSSMFASLRFAPDDLKMTLGTGAFLNVNTNNTIHTSVTGIYPVIGWEINNNVVYLGEVPSNDCGSIIEWLLKSHLIASPLDISSMCDSIEGTEGVYFIPAFSGLGPPINDDRAGSGFIGVQPTTSKAHLVRAVIEGIVYRLALAFETLKKERPRNYKSATVDGGVSQSDFICQLLADLTGLTIQKQNSHELSSRGVGYLAGMNSKIWTIEDIKNFGKIQMSFVPSKDGKSLERKKNACQKWLEAVTRFKHFMGQ